METNETKEHFQQVNVSEEIPRLFFCSVHKMIPHSLNNTDLLFHQICFSCIGSEFEIAVMSSRWYCMTAQNLKVFFCNQQTTTNFDETSTTETTTELGLLN